jgi:hypothetical protein
MPPKGFVWVLAVAFAALVGTAIAPNASAIAPSASASLQPPSGHRRLQSGTCLAATSSCTGMLCGDIDCGAFGTCYEGDCYCTAGYSNPNSLDARVGAGSNVGCSIAEGAATIQTDHTGALSVPVRSRTGPLEYRVHQGQSRRVLLRLAGLPVLLVAENSS